jgi:hypothetical protein
MTQLIELAENINILPGLIVSIFLAVINVTALLALLGNIKIPHTQKIIRFKEKRVRLKLADIPKTFDDWETHYAEYKELVKNYRRNYQKLLDKEIFETEEDKEIEREITPYHVMADVADVVGKNDRPSVQNFPTQNRNSSELRMSAVIQNQPDHKLLAQSRLLIKETKNQTNGETAGDMNPVIDQAEPVALFNNPELRDLFDQNKDVADQYEIMNRNRKKTNIAAGAEQGDLEDIKHQYAKSMIKMQNAEREKEKKLDEFLYMFKDNVNQFKTIDPHDRKKVEMPRQMKVSIVPEDSLNFFEDDDMQGLQFNPTHKVLNPSRVANRPELPEQDGLRKPTGNLARGKITIFGPGD